MVIGGFGGSGAESGRGLADFVSKFVSPPVVALAVAVVFSLWSPIGLGGLRAPLSIILCFWLFAFFPFLPVLYYYRKNVVDLYVSQRKDRTPFFLVAIAAYVLASVIFFVTGTTILFLFGLGFTFVTLILLVVNRFWKVSVHSAGVTGPIFALIFVFGVAVLPLSVLIVLVCWSRIKLRNHTFRQTVVGSLIAIGVGLVVYPVLYQVA